MSQRSSASGCCRQGIVAVPICSASQLTKHCPHESAGAGTLSSVTAPLGARHCPKIKHPLAEALLALACVPPLHLLPPPTSAPVPWLCRPPDMELPVSGLSTAASGLCSNGISKKGCPRLLCLEEQPHHSVRPSLHWFHVTSQHSDIYFFVSVALSPRTHPPGESGLCELCSLLYP